MRNKIFLALLTASLCGYVSLPDATAQSTTGNSSTKIPLDPAVHTGKLPNGLTYFIRKNTYPEKRVLLYIVTKAGSVLETENQRGLAHFLEHMNFNGTTHFPKNELVSYLEKSGVKFGADLNAYTSFDETVYQLPLPSDDPAVLANGLLIIRDWAHGALLEPTEIDKERGVILEEKRARSGLQQRVMDKTLPVLLNKSIYADRLPIGTEQVLRNFKPKEIRDFYDQWYRPDLQAVIVVGDIDPVAMEQKIKTLFADLKNPASEKKRPVYSIPLTGKKQFLAFTDAEAQQVRVELINKFRSEPLETTGDYRNQLVENLMDGMLAQRYSRLAHSKDVSYVSASVGTSGYMADLDVFSFAVTLKPGQAENGFKMAYRELSRVNKDGFTQPELDFCKKTIENGLERMLREKDKVQSSNYVDGYLSYFTKEEAAPDINTEYALSKKYLAEITLEDINQLVKRLINLPDQDIVITGPDKEKDAIPTQQQLNEWIAQVKSEKTEPYNNNTANERLIQSLPPAGKVLSSKELASPATTMYTLSNGVKVVFKPTDFKNDEILINSFKAGGTSLCADNDYISAANAATIISAGGVGNFNIDDLRNQLNGKSLQVAPYINELYEGFNGASSKKDLETALQLIHLYMTQPRKDTVMFNNIVSNARVSLAAKSRSADAVFGDTVATVLGNYHPRRISPDTVTLKNLSLEKAYDFYKSSFSNASGFTFIFTGSFAPEQLLPLCEQYLGSLPSDTTVKSNFRDLNIQVPGGTQEHLVYKGSNPRSTVQLVISGNHEYKQTNNIQLQALSEIIELRLTERLRETEGGVYTPQTNVSYVKYPKNSYYFVIRFVCAPENAQKLADAAREEMLALAEKGVPAGDLEKFKAESLRGFQVQLRENKFWLSVLSSKLSNSESLGDVDTYEKVVNGLTPDMLQNAAKKYLDTKNYIKFILYPEGKK